VPIAPRTYYAHIARAPSKRALWDTTVVELLAGIYEPDQHGRRRPESLYGSVKTWAYLQRGGFPVARCTVERLMRAHGWRGTTRARKVRTTVADPAAARAADLVNRCFTAERPDALWVADFTYVPLAGGGFGYTAFVIDAFAGYIPGWECSLSKHTAFVESALRQATALRARQGHPVGGGTIHHSDAGSQLGLNRSSQHRCSGTIVDHRAGFGSEGSQPPGSGTVARRGLFPDRCQLLPAGGRVKGRVATGAAGAVGALDAAARERDTVAAGHRSYLADERPQCT
jgi:hypothetical protein